MNRALFLDRDGVINEEINYLHKPEDVRFIDGIFEVCRYFRDQAFLIIVITNQAGIGRGYYTEQAFQSLSRWMIAAFAGQNITISKIYHCPYHPTEGLGEFRKNSYDRKPKPGMIFKARDDFQLDLKSSILVGDRNSDIKAGINAGVGTTILFRPSGAGESSAEADFVINSFSALKNIVGRH